MDSSREQSLSTIESSSECLTVKKIKTPTKESIQIDEEIEIQTQRIIIILDEIIYKTEIAIVLLNDDCHNDLFKVFENSMSPDELDIIKNILTENPLLETTLIDEYQEIIDLQIQDMIQMPNRKIFPKLSQVFWSIIKYSNLRSVIRERIKNIKEEKPQNPLICYLDNLTKFKIKIFDKLSMSAEDKLKADMVLRNVTRSNKNLNQSIKEIVDKLKQEKKSFQNLFNEQDEIIKTHKCELNSLEEDCKRNITEKIIESQNQLKDLKESHLFAVNILTQKIKECEEHYEKLLQDHMSKEVELKISRIEMENELLDWLKKYDNDVGGKQIYLDELTKSYEEEKNQYEELKRQFDEQEAIYIPMMAEKQADYEREVLGKMKAFLREHAARVLQRTWRRILAARAEKKKKKGGGKKKKGKLKKKIVTPKKKTEKKIKK